MSSEAFKAGKNNIEPRIQELLAREFFELRQYLEEGGLVDKDRLLVQSDVLRELLLRAGFVYLALGDWFESDRTGFAQAMFVGYRPLKPTARDHWLKDRKYDVWLTPKQILELIDYEGVQTTVEGSRLAGIRTYVLGQLVAIKAEVIQLRKDRNAPIGMSSWDLGHDGIVRMQVSPSPQSCPDLFRGPFSLAELKLCQHNLGPMINHNTDFMVQAVKLLEKDDFRDPNTRQLLLQVMGERISFATHSCHEFFLELAKFKQNEPRTDVSENFISADANNDPDEILTTKLESYGWSQAGPRSKTIYESWMSAFRFLNNRMADGLKTQDYSGCKELLDTLYGSISHWTQIWRGLINYASQVQETTADSSFPNK